MFFGILQKFEINFIPNEIVGNVLTAILLSGMLSWLIHSIYIWTEKTRIRESYIISNGVEITYHMLNEGNTEFSSSSTYYTYHITQINNIVEKPYYYKVQGVIELNKSDDRGQCYKTKQINIVKIPKYFADLDKLFNDLRSN